MNTKNHFILRATICTLALFSLLSYPLPVSAAGHYISVRVICKIGVGVANVRVQLIPKAPNTANNPGYDFRTDKSGRVSFKNFRSGTYAIVVTCGAATYTHTIYTGAGLADFSHDYVFRCCGTAPGAPPNPDDGLIGIDDKAVTDDVTAGSKAASRAVVAYTRDWQPGDEVSFSFSGNVYGPSGEKQTQEEYTDHLVGIVDSQGNKTEIPWKQLIRYKVPEAATSVTASLMKPDRTIITTANIPVHPKGTPLPIQLPPKITGNCVASPVSQIGQPYTVYDPKGKFSGDANKIKLLTTNKIDNATTESNAVAASPRSAVFNPQNKEPGYYEYTVIDEGRFEDSFEVSAVGIKLDTSRAYRIKQEGTLVIIVALPRQADAQQKLLSENLQVAIEMETPSVLAFSNGQNEVLWSLQKREVANNKAQKEFRVRAGTPGTFVITARAKTPRCNNPSVTKTGLLTAVRGIRLSLAKLNVADQENVFRGMSPELKCAVWKDRIAEALEKPLKEKQRNVLLRIEARMKPEIYQVDNNAEKTQFSDFFKAWETEAYEAFANEDSRLLVQIFTQLSDSIGNAKVIQITPAATIPDCDCVQGSWMCGISIPCRSVPCRINACGFMWWRTCNGMC